MWWKAIIRSRLVRRIAIAVLIVIAKELGHRRPQR